ncbi:hypothetical protein FRC04_000611 [Tulasnella sp. 424]|nr:hypothetical protein FRC04_000611 [Tulasnella sp. 424]KAG8969145.1 hypothetical protein FRC05_001189 [Tulasnella sp. 425]
MDLFNCAQVCKSWKDDALNVRWRYCSVGMRQLMGQLAPMEEEEEHDYDCDYLVYNRLQTSLEEFDKDRWQTFLRLTSKVQVLSNSTFLLHEDSVELVKELIATYGGPLFPNLRRFNISGDSKIPPVIAFSLVPGLTSVMIDGMEPPSGDDGFEEILALVSENCKGIKNLELHPDCAESAPSFSAFPELRTLTYWSGPLSVESWSSLASCKNLAELKLFFPDLGEVEEDSLAEDLEFGALRQLDIFRMDKQAVIALLDGTRMPLLHTLRLEEVEFTEDERKDLTDRLKARCLALKRIDFVSKAK